MPFRDIVGHHGVLSLLARAVARDTLPPSLLLAGPTGVGKARTALALAQVLNCLQLRTGAEATATAPEEERLEIDACGECLACRRIARGVHPDVITLQPDDMGSIKIEPVRDVIDRAAYRPFEGRRRVVIVNEADAMAAPAQNALLKTLEEPPPASVFLLVSSMPDALLATVRSRCPRLRFGELTAAEVATTLLRDHGYTEAEAHAAAAETEGSIGQALAARSVDFAKAREAAHRLLEHAASGMDPVRRIEAAKELTAKKSTSANEREQLAVCLRALASLLRDLGILSSRADARLVASVDLRADLARLAGAYDSKRTEQAFKAVDEALGALERNVNPRVVADWLLLRL